MVYVDGLVKYTMSHNPALGKRLGCFWCHMWADSVEELHSFAQGIGMKRSWFQNHKRFPHYDLVPSKREEAVQRGAQECTLRKWYRKSIDI